MSTLVYVAAAVSVFCAVICFTSALSVEAGRQDMKALLGALLRGYEESARRHDEMTKAHLARVRKLVDEVKKERGEQ